MTVGLRNLDCSYHMPVCGASIAAWHAAATCSCSYIRFFDALMTSSALFGTEL